jgi:hypothetical protein
MTTSQVPGAGVLVALAMATLAVAQDAPRRPSWRGTFADGAVGLRLDAVADGYEGSLALPARTLTVRGQLQPDGTLAGTLASEARTYAFTARLEGDTVVLTTGPDTYRLARRAPPAPRPGPANAGAATDEREALTRALEWLKRHQDEDGSWSADAWAARCAPQPCAGPGTDRGDARYRVGVTALATLAFLRAGAARDERRRIVERAVGWLHAQQAIDGSIGFSARHGEGIYNHAFATQALAVAAAELPQNAGAPIAAGAARDAVAFCLVAQNPGLGWKYGVKAGRSDTSVTTAMVEALHAARGRIDIPDDAFQGAASWALRATDAEGNTGYETPGGGSSFLGPNDGKFDLLPVTTAEGIVARRLFDPLANVRRSAMVVRAAPPAWAPRALNFVYWYYGTRASALVGGEDWRQWRLAVIGALVPNQRRDGCAAGSWDGVDEWALVGGRVYATALNALTLTLTLD